MGRTGGDSSAVGEGGLLVSSDIGLGHIAVVLADMRARGVPADAKLQLLIETVSSCRLRVRA